MFDALPEFWEDANGEGMPKPLALFLFFFCFCTNHTAIRRRLSTTNPTAIPIATAPPVFNPPEPLDEEFAVIFVLVVDLAVGFCVGMVGKGEGMGFEELPGGAGGDERGGGKEDEGSEGGGDGNVDPGGTVSAGGGAD